MTAFVPVDCRGRWRSLAMPNVHIFAGGLPRALALPRNDERPHLFRWIAVVECEILRFAQDDKSRGSWGSAVVGFARFAAFAVFFDGARRLFECKSVDVKVQF